MQGWIEGFQASIDFMEQHLTEPLDMERIAGKALLSPFYYQRMFGALCGMTVGEYVRSRRMTLAAQELAAGQIKVIDAALKYGYDSPDSFATASRRPRPGKAARPCAPLLPCISKSQWKVEKCWSTASWKRPRSPWWA